MKNSHDIFKENGLVALKNILSSGDDKGKEDKLLYAIMALLLYSGSEGISIIFRNNFGRNGLNIGMIIGCFIGLGGIAGFSFYFYFTPEKMPEGYGSPLSYLITGIFFSIIAIFILVRGIVLIWNALEAGDLSEYPGESNLLSFLKKERWSDGQIKFIAEPFTVISIGGAYAFFNLMGGLALMFCAVSVWARALVEIIILGNPILQKINQHSANSSANKSKNRVS